MLPPLDRTRRLTQVVVALASMAVAVSGGAPADAVADGLAGEVALGPLPIAIVRVDAAADVAGAAEVAARAGATPIWADALPPGAAPAGVTPLPAPAEALVAPRAPGLLAPGRRLRLPEGRDAIMSLSASQLGPGTPAGLLAGRAALVVVAPDGALARGPAAALALALVPDHAGWLWSPPWAASALLALTLALALGRLAERWTLPVGALVAAGGGVVLLAAVAVARAGGLDLPVGLALVPPLAWGGRALTLLVISREVLDHLGVHFLEHAAAASLSPVPAGGKAPPTAPRTDSRDPEIVRLLLASRAGAASLAGAEEWNPALGEGGMVVAVFGRDGRLRVASAAARDVAARGIHFFLQERARLSALAVSNLVTSVQSGAPVRPTWLEGTREVLEVRLVTHGQVLVQLVPANAPSYRSRFGKSPELLPDSLPLDMTDPTGIPTAPAPTRSNTGPLARR